MSKVFEYLDAVGIISDDDVSYGTERKDEQGIDIPYGFTRFCRPEAPTSLDATLPLWAV